MPESPSPLSRSPRKSPLWTALTAGLLLVSQAVGHVMRTSENQDVQECARAFDFFDSAAGAPMLAGLTNSAIHYPNRTPVDGLIDAGQEALREAIR